jgi:transcriptional regulator with XRE-family HTH domain
MNRELATLKKNIGSRIRMRRNDLRISQEDLAFRAGLTPTYLSLLENGKRNPSLELLYRVCSALQIELAEILKN